MANRKRKNPYLVSTIIGMTMAMVMLAAILYGWWWVVDNHFWWAVAFVVLVIPVALVVGLIIALLSGR